MIVQHDHPYQNSPMLPSIPRYSEKRNQQTANTHTFIPTSRHSYLNSNRDFTSQSLKLKNQRNHQFTLLSERELNNINSLKGSFHQNLNGPKSQINHKISNQKQIKAFPKQTKITQFYMKNSLMNKILSHHKKVNKINFSNTKSQLFSHFHNSNNIYLNQNISEVKPQSDSPNDKIIALLNDRPFRKNSHLKYNINKLKIIKNIQNLDSNNILLKTSLKQPDFEGDEGQNSERQSFSQYFKNNRSLKFIKKPLIRTDLLKGCPKSLNKIQNIMSLDGQQNLGKKKSVLVISDDDKSQRNLDTIVSEFSQKFNKSKQSKIKNDNHPKQYHSDQKHVSDNHQKRDQKSLKMKCQERILSDLIKIEQTRNKRSFAENKILHLKNTRSLAQSIKKIKLQAKEKDKLRNHKIQYLVKFKTEPEQSPQQKLQARLSRIIPQIETLRNKILSETKFGREQISGIPQTLNGRGHEKRGKVGKEACSLKGTNVRRYEQSLMEKAVTGWDFQNEAEGNESWNFRF